KKKPVSFLLSVYAPSPYKSIARVYPLAALPLRNLNDSIAVKIRRGLSEVKSERRAQRMLGAGVGISIQSCHSDSMPPCRPSNSPAQNGGLVPRYFCGSKPGPLVAYSAISPRLAMRIEFRPFPSRDARVEELRRRNLGRRRERWRRPRRDMGRGIKGWDL